MQKTMEQNNMRDNGQMAIGWKRKDIRDIIWGCPSDILVIFPLRRPVLLAEFPNLLKTALM